MNPRMIPLPDVPVMRIRFKAMRSCSLCFSRASAIIKPPRKRKIMGFAYGAADARIFITPSKGKSISGRKDVTGMGTASDTHHVIIHAATARTLYAPGEINDSGRKSHSRTNRVGPRKKPKRRAEGSEFTFAKGCLSKTIRFDCLCKQIVT